MRTTTLSSTGLVVLDMAGTTVHDDGLVLECFVAAAEAVGLAATRAELNERMGLSKLEVFDELSMRQLGPGPKAETLRDQGYDGFRRILEAAYERGGVSPVRGAERVIAWLKERHVQVALNTGFYRRVTEIIIDRLGWKNTVDAVVCADDVPEGRPAPYLIHTSMQRCGVHSVGQVVVVGDTPADVLAGKNSGASAVIAVTSGSHDAASLRRFPATHLMESIRELPQVLERMERIARVLPSAGHSQG